MDNLFSVLTFLLFSCTIFQTKGEKHNGFSLRLIHRFSPESPSFQPELSDEQIMKELVQMSNTRAQYLAYSKTNNISFGTSNHQTFRSAISMADSLTYLVQIGMGTFYKRPPYHIDNYLAFDTGGKITWTQCEGCNPCFRQNYPPFRRNQSRSYHALPCNQCQGACQHGQCEVQYKCSDGSQVYGVAATETFAFQTNSTRDHVSVENVPFTCALRVQNFKRSERPVNYISGVLGMTRDSSLITQIYDRTNWQFSYCLHPFETRARLAPSMLLRFGDNTPRQWQYSTPLLIGPDGVASSYYLGLMGLSVGETKLNIHPGIFEFKRDLSGGCLIDSGTAFTRIITPAYEILETYMAEYISRHNQHLQRTTVYHGLRLCYSRKLASAQNIFPRVTFHFAGGADFVVQGDAVMMGFPSESTGQGSYCLAILPNDHITVLGAKQQVNHRILYDLKRSRLSFTHVDCTTSD